MSANKGDHENENPDGSLSNGISKRDVASEHKQQDQKSQSEKGSASAKAKQHNSGSFPVRQYLQRLWKESSPHDHLMLALTCVIAFSTFWYMVFAGWTLYEIYVGSQDTHRLAVAAQDQAQTAKSALASSERAFRERERAYLWDSSFNLSNPPVCQIPGGTRICGDVHVLNSGRTPAIGVRIYRYATFGPHAERTVRALKVPTYRAGSTAQVCLG